MLWAGTHACLNHDSDAKHSFPLTCIIFNSTFILERLKHLQNDFSALVYRLDETRLENKGFCGELGGGIQEHYR